MHSEEMKTCEFIHNLWQRAYNPKRYTTMWYSAPNGMVV